MRTIIHVTLQGAAGFAGMSALLAMIPEGSGTMPWAILAAGAAAGIILIDAKI